MNSLESLNWVFIQQGGARQRRIECWIPLQVVYCSLAIRQLIIPRRSSRCLCVAVAKAHDDFGSPITAASRNHYVIWLSDDSLKRHHTFPGALLPRRKFRPSIILGSVLNILKHRHHTEIICLCVSMQSSQQFIFGQTLSLYSFDYVNAKT